MSKMLMEVNFLTVDGEKKIQCTRWKQGVGGRVRDEQWITPKDDLSQIMTSDHDCAIFTKNYGWYAIHKAYEIYVDGVRASFTEFIELLNYRLECNNEW